MPAAVLSAAALGLLLGLTSWRVSGDYFAIVTLFFLQIMLTLAINIDSPDFAFWEIPPEWHITNGPNGISTVDPFAFFGAELGSLDAYYFVAVGAIVLLLAALYLVNHSRVGRGWRSQREDVLAAELMGMRVRWLKLSAFAYGAAVAGLAGPILAGSHGAVFPSDFDLTVLITVYAMVILGGLGSLAGVMLGAIVLNVALEVLREPGGEHRLLRHGARRDARGDPAAVALGRRRRDTRLRRRSPRRRRAGLAEVAGTTAGGPASTSSPRTG